MKYLRYTLNRSWFLLIMVSCGVEVGNPGQTGTGPKVSSNETAVSFAAEDQYSEVVNGATDVFDSRSLGLRLLQESDFERQYSCDDSGDVAIVSKNISGERVTQRGSSRLARTITETSSRSTVATWSADSGSISCSGNRVQVSWADLDSVSLEISNSSQRTSTVVRDSTAETLRYKQISVDGTRSISIVRSGAGIQETISYDLARSTTYESSRGQGAISHRITVVPGKPIVANKEYRDNRLTSMTIASGSVQSDFDDGTVVVTSFNSLVFSSSSCTPSSGTISGSVYEDSVSETASSTFEVSFVNGYGTISYDGGEGQYFETERCTFN